MDLERWQRANDEFLAMRLAWLRSRFAQMLEPHDTNPKREREDYSDNSSTGAQSESQSDSMPGPHCTVSEVIAGKDTHRRGFSAAAGTRSNCIDDPIPSGLDLLSQRLGLSPFEQNVLMLCAAMEFDTRMPALCAQAQADSARSYPTFALAMTLFDDPAWDAMSPDRPLRRFRLIEITQPGSTPLTAAALRADERIVNYLKGLNYLDDRLAPLFLPFDTTADIPLPASQQLIVTRIVEQLEQHSRSDSPDRLPIVQLVGPDTASKQLIARRVAAAFGLELQRIPADIVPSDFTELETLLRLWDREHRLLPLALYIDASETDGAVLERPASPQNRFLARAGGLVFLDTPDVRHPVGRPSLVFDIAKPTATEQRDLWLALLGTDQTEPATQLSGQFSLNAPAIHRIASPAAPELPLPTGERVGVRGLSVDLPFADLWTACRRATRPRLDALAQRIDARATWDDLVLPTDEHEQLREIAGQVRHRGRVYDDWGFRAKHNRGLGVSVLFAGESGTGKTMAAEVIANDLQLDLYRIDLSAVVSKYIGETEKNLRRLFDAADDGGVILFFDEADALFGKRTEVRDSHDRYANIEVNYLLQRMEAYRGLAILATNQKGSLDTAFLRRLRFIINFPIPDTAQRRELWRKAFPSETPLASLDLERLSRLNVTGGNIHTIALNAAFSSAGNGQQVTMPHVLQATRGEFRKLQKPINAGDFLSHELEGGAR